VVARVVAVARGAASPEADPRAAGVRRGTKQPGGRARTPACLLEPGVITPRPAPSSLGRAWMSAPKTHDARRPVSIRLSRVCSMALTSDHPMADLGLVARDKQRTVWANEPRDILSTSLP